LSRIIYTCSYEVLSDLLAFRDINDASSLHSKTNI
jgi:hypothetical protein